MKVSRSKLFPIILLIIIVLVIILYFLNNLYTENKPTTSFYGSVFGQKVIENLDEVKKRTFEDKDDGVWHTVRKGGFRSSRITNLNLSNNNPKLSISFYLKITKTYGDWRNVFHFTSTGSDCCSVGSRVPAMWVHGGSTKLYIRFDTRNGGDDGVANVEGVSLNKPVLITIIFNGDNFKYYINSDKKFEKTYNGIRSRVKETEFYIGDPWYNNDGGIKISGFTVYDDEILQCEIDDRVSKMPSS